MNNQVEAVLKMSLVCVVITAIISNYILLGCDVMLFGGHVVIYETTVMCCLMTGIHSEKCVVTRFLRCANVIQCTYTNLDSTV